MTRSFWSVTTSKYTTNILNMSNSNQVRVGSRVRIQGGHKARYKNITGTVIRKLRKLTTVAIDAHVDQWMTVIVSNNSCKLSEPTLYRNGQRIYTKFGFSGLYVRHSSDEHTLNLLVEPSVLECVEAKVRICPGTFRKVCMFYVDVFC